MISRAKTLIYPLAVLFFIHYLHLSSGTPLNGRSSGAVKNNLACDELLDKQGWKIEDILRNKSTLDECRSKCTPSHLIDLFDLFNDTRRDENTPLHEYAASGDVNAVQFLVEGLKFRVDVRNAHNETPSHFAAEKGQLSTLKYLFEKGANVNARDELGDNLLHFAASNGWLNVVKYLVEQKRMKIDSENYFGHTPLLLAVLKGKLDVVRYLAGEKKANRYIKDHQRTLLHYAVHSRNLDLVRYLVDEADLLPLIDQLSATHHTAAMEAANRNELEILKFLVDSRHASTTVLDEKGHNMLHIAAINGFLPIASYLVEEKGFDVNAKNSDGRTAHDLAKKHARSQVSEYLQNKMKF